MFDFQYLINQLAHRYNTKVLNQTVANLVSKGRTFSGDYIGTSKDAYYLCVKKVLLLS